jgi:hypothetical protein
MRLHDSGATRGSPDFAPVVVSSNSSLPSKGPPTLAAFARTSSAISLLNVFNVSGSGTSVTFGQAVTPCDLFPEAVLSFYRLSAEVLSPRRGVPPDRAFTAAGLVGRSVGITTQPDHEVLTLHDTVATLRPTSAAMRPSTAIPEALPGGCSCPAYKRDLLRRAAFGGRRRPARPLRLAVSRSSTVPQGRLTRYPGAAPPSRNQPVRTVFLRLTAVCRLDRS